MKALQRKWTLGTRLGWVTMLALALFMHARQAVATDRLILENGDELDGEILDWDGKRLLFRTNVGGGVAEIPYPAERVEAVLLSGHELEDLGGLETEELRRRWQRRLQFAALNQKDAGRHGLALAHRLALGSKEEATAALEVIETLRRNIKLPQVNAEAAGLRLTALAGAGRIQDALDEAAAMERIVGADERGLEEAAIRIALLNAGLAWQQLLELEDEWPRWHLMPEIREQRRALLHQALDGFLQPVAFYAHHRELAAEGLFRAASGYAHLGSKDEAMLRLREVENRFPGTAWLDRAKELMNQLESNTTHQGTN